MKWLILFTACIISLADGLAVARPGPDSNYNISVTAGGGGSPTWTATGTGQNNSCGFTTTCTIASVTVTAGFNVASIFDYNGGSAAGITAVTVCGTSFTQVVTNGNAADGYLEDLWSGTVSSGGTCSVVLTTTGQFANAGVAIGNFTNLTSTTATSTCLLAVTGGTNTPYTCSSAVTVPSNGFAIVGFGYNQTGTITASGGTFTLDLQANTTMSVAIGHNGTAGSLTPSAAGTGFAHGGIVAATWH